MRRMSTQEPIQDYTPTLSEVQEEFLALIAEYGTTDMAAAAAVGRSRWTVIDWKKKPAFLARYKEARRVGLDQLVREAERRALNGSDRLLEFLLCNYAPERFSSKQKVEHAGGINLSVTTGVPEGDGCDLAG